MFQLLSFFNFKHKLIRLLAKFLLEIFSSYRQFLLASLELHFKLNVGAPVCVCGFVEFELQSL